MTQHWNIASLSVAFSLALASAASPTRAELRQNRLATSAASLSHQNFREISAFYDPINTGDVNYPLLEAAVFLVTVEQRVAHGLRPIGYHPLLAEAARGHAERMASQGFYDHVDPTSKALATPRDRASRAGIANPTIAENIHNYFAIQYEPGTPVYVLDGRGQFSYQPGGDPIAAHSYLSFAEAVVADWMDSPGHRANILSEQARQLGVGLAFHWRGDWPQFMAVQNFQTYRDVIAKPGASQGRVEPIEPTPAPRKQPAPRAPDYEPDYESAPQEPDYESAPQAPDYDYESAPQAPDYDYAPQAPGYDEPAPRRDRRWRRHRRAASRWT